MTNKEAEQIRDICYTADGGCQSCARGLLDQLAREFPEHDAFKYDERAHDKYLYGSLEGDT